MRTTYRNGDEITLQHTGCDGCSPSMINGHLYHESGCPNAWQDQKVDCCECDYSFYPESQGEQFCPDCRKEIVFTDA